MNIWHQPLFQCYVSFYKAYFHNILSVTVAIRISNLPYKVKNTLRLRQIGIDVNVPNIPQRCWVYRSDIDLLHCFEFLHSQSKRLCFHVFSPSSDYLRARHSCPSPPIFNTLRNPAGNGAHLYFLIYRLLSPRLFSRWNRGLFGCPYVEFSIRVLNFFKIIRFRPWNVLSGICRLALACRSVFSR